MMDQQTSDLWWEYRKEKLTAPCLHIFFLHFYNFYKLLTKLEPSKKIKSLFYSSVKTSLMKHGIANESVALAEYETLLTTQSVTVNLVQPRLIKITSFCCDIT